MPAEPPRTIQIDEIERGPRPIAGVATSTAALLGEAGRGPVRPRLVTSLGQYERAFGRDGAFLPAAVRGFFENGGARAFICRITGPADLARGLATLEPSAFREVALVAAPGLTDAPSTGAIIAHSEAHRRFAVIDCGRGDPRTLDPRSDRATAMAAAYAPWLEVQPPAGGSRSFVPPSGHVLGIYARTDAGRGVWAAPANEEVRGALGLEHEIGEADQTLLNPRGVNVIRRFAGRGIRVWGARTLSADPEWKYVSVRRLLLFLERSIEAGTQWVVFEPNGEPLWAAVRNQIEQFLYSQWRAGALLGDRPQAAFFVRCDRTTMTQDDVDSGRLVAEIGFAPVRPAEFVIFRIGQWTRDKRP